MFCRWFFCVILITHEMHPFWWHQLRTISLHSISRPTMIQCRRMLFARRWSNRTNRWLENCIVVCQVHSWTHRERDRVSQLLSSTQILWHSINGLAIADDHWSNQNNSNRDLANFTVDICVCRRENTDKQLHALQSAKQISSKENDDWTGMSRRERRRDRENNLERMQQCVLRWTERIKKFVRWKSKYLPTSHNA